jgi:hypothetical protein
MPWTPTSAVDTRSDNGDTHFYGSKLSVEVYLLRDEPGRWFMSCMTIGMFRVALDATGLHEAKLEAIALADARLTQLLEAAKIMAEETFSQSGGAR